MPMPDADASARCRIGQLPVSIAQSVLLLGQRAAGTSTVRSCGDLRASFSPRLTPESDSITRRRLGFGAPGPARADAGERSSGES